MGLQEKTKYIPAFISNSTQIADGVITAAKIVTGVLIVGTNVGIGTALGVGEAAADVNANVTTINGGKITTNSIAASAIIAGSLVVGTNVGLGTAQDASGVTTIIGSTVTTGFINALNITVLGTVTAGTLTGITINGSTITGGTIQTSAITGQKIIISGTANDLILYDTSGNQLFNIGTSSSVISTIVPKSGYGALLIQGPDATTSNPLVEIDMENASSTTAAVIISQYGTGNALTISGYQASANSVVNISSGVAQPVMIIASSYSGTTPENVLTINAAGMGNASVIKISNSGNGSVLEIDDNYTGNDSNESLLITRQASAGAAVYIYNANAAGSGDALDVTQASSGYAASFSRGSADNTIAVLGLGQSATVSTYFKRFINFAGVTMWTSNGNNPNGALSATSGDICLNGPGGAPYWCGGGTTWTAF